MKHGVVLDEIEIDCDLNL